MNKKCNGLISVEDAISNVLSGCSTLNSEELNISDAFGRVLAKDLVSQGKLGRVRLIQGHWGRGERGEPDHLPRTGLRSWWEDPVAMGGGTQNNPKPQNNTQQTTTTQTKPTQQSN